MKYVEQTLKDGETTILRVQIHPCVFLVPGLILSIGAIITLFGMVVGHGPELLLLGSIVVASALGLLVSEWLMRVSTKTIVTTHRLVKKRGLLWFEVFENDLRRIESVVVTQSPLGRLFDYGTVIVQGPQKLTFRSISHPLEFRKVVFRYLISGRSLVKSHPSSEGLELEVSFNPRDMANREPKSPIAKRMQSGGAEPFSLRSSDFASHNDLR